MPALTEENYKSLAALNYLSPCTACETEFDKDLSLALKISQQINKMERGDPKANTRLMINYVVTLFNVFEYDFARKLLFFMVDPRNHPRLLAILIGTNRATSLHIKATLPEVEDVEPCVNTLSLIKAELTP